RTFAGHDNVINGLAFTPDGQTLLTAGWDATVRVWDVATGQQRRQWQAHPTRGKCPAGSPDGQQVPAGRGGPAGGRAVGPGGGAADELRRRAAGDVLGRL